MVGMDQQGPIWRRVRRLPGRPYLAVNHPVPDEGWPWNPL